MTTPKTALLFSGGDAPGMNQFLRAWVRMGITRYPAEMIGICDGFRGLLQWTQAIDAGAFDAVSPLAALPVFRPLGEIDQPVFRLDYDSVGGLASRGGIVLGTSRYPEFRHTSARRVALNVLHRLGIETLVVCGGEGSLTAAALMTRESDLQIIGVPATIDNDLPVTDLALGFDTAVNTVATTARRFNDTAGSHHRMMVLEVMGRGSGHLAVYAALASGAELVVTPERGALDESRMSLIARRLHESFARGRRHAIVIVAEGVQVSGAAGAAGPAATLGSFLQQYFSSRVDAPVEIETRVSVLGHLQRGGPPTSADQILAARFAAAAWQATADASRPSGIVRLRGGQVSQASFAESASASTPLMAELYQMQKDITRLPAGSLLSFSQ